MKGQRGRTPGERGRRRDAEFEIPSGFEADLLSLQKRLAADGLPKLTYNSSVGLIDELAVGELAEEPFEADRPEPTQNAGQLEWRNTIDAEHVQRFGIVAEHHRAALAGTPPKALLSKRELPALDVQPHVRVQKSRTIRSEE